MRNSPAPVIVLAAMCLAVPGMAAAAVEARATSGDPDATRRAVEKAIARVKPSLVRIHVVWTEYESGREVKFESFGSGTIITPEGHVVTNHHVAGRAKQIFCTLSSRDEVEADLVGTDPLTDISVIRLRPERGSTHPVAVFGDSSVLKVGDTVLAMGSPLALSQSVTMGIVSNTEMIQPPIFGPFKFKLEGEDVGSVVRWIGHDAPIYGGNSGGPLVNLRGEIVGVNEISIGLAGAIPGNLARDVADRIIKRGKVVRAWLGIEVQPLLKTQKGKGVLVAGTLDDTPAARAGFRPGDILVNLGGRDVNARFREEIPIFNQYVHGLAIGKTIDAVVRRDGKTLTLKVTPDERGETKPRPREILAWGITARNISVVIARELKRSTTDGVVITSVRPGGPAAEAKPRVGEKDVITAVDGTPVKNLEQLVAYTDKVLDGKKDASVPVLVAYERDDEKYLTVVSVGVRPDEESGREVKKAWLPLAFQVLTTDLAGKIGVPGRKGVRVTQLYPVSEVKESGLEVGDLIVAVDGTELPVSQPEDYEVLPAQIRQYRIGAAVTFTVVRDGKERAVALTLPGAPPGARELKRYRSESFEFEARDIAFMDRVHEQWSADQKGVVIDEVSQGGWAAIGQLAGGDLLLEIDGRDMPDIPALKKSMTAIEERKPAVIIFHVLRGIHHTYLEMKPGWPKK